MSRLKKVIDIQGFSLSKPAYQDTLDGMAYYAELHFNGNIVGFVENKGTGGSTNIIIIKPEIVNEFNEKMELYFNYTLGFNSEGISQHSKEYTFAEHLLDMRENGNISNELLKMKWLR